MFWHLKKPKIHHWVDYKEIEFAYEESKGSRLSPKKWLGIYINKDIHDILFSEFPIMLHEWLSKLANWRKTFQGGEPTQWSLQLIKWLEKSVILYQGMSTLGLIEFLRDILLRLQSIL